MIYRRYSSQSVINHRSVNAFTRVLASTIFAVTIFRQSQCRNSRRHAQPPIVTSYHALISDALRNNRSWRHVWSSDNTPIHRPRGPSCGVFYTPIDWCVWCIRVHATGCLYAAKTDSFIQWLWYMTSRKWWMEWRRYMRRGIAPPTASVPHSTSFFFSLLSNTFSGRSRLWYHS